MLNFINGIGSVIKNALCTTHPYRLTSALLSNRSRLPALKLVSLIRRQGLWPMSCKQNRMNNHENEDLYLTFVLYALDATLS